MDPIAILGQVYGVIDKLHTAHENVKQFPEDSQELIDRIDDFRCMYLNEFEKHPEIISDQGNQRRIQQFKKLLEKTHVFMKTLTTKSTLGKMMKSKGIIATFNETHKKLDRLRDDFNISLTFLNTTASLNMTQAIAADKASKKIIDNHNNNNNIQQQYERRQSLENSIQSLKQWLKEIGIIDYKECSRFLHNELGIESKEKLVNVYRARKNKKLNKMKLELLDFKSIGLCKPADQITLKYELDNLFDNQRRRPSINDDIILIENWLKEMKIIDYKEAAKRLVLRMGLRHEVQIIKKYYSNINISTATTSLSSSAKNEIHEPGFNLNKCFVLEGDIDTFKEYMKRNKGTYGYKSSASVVKLASIKKKKSSKQEEKQEQEETTKLLPQIIRPTTPTPTPAPTPVTVPKHQGEPSYKEIKEAVMKNDTKRIEYAILSGELPQGEEFFKFRIDGMNLLHLCVKARTSLDVCKLIIKECIFKPNGVIIDDDLLKKKKTTLLNNNKKNVNNNNKINVNNNVNNTKKSSTTTTTPNDCFFKYYENNSDCTARMKNDYGFSPLHDACQTNQVKMIELFITIFQLTNQDFNEKLLVGGQGNNPFEHGLRYTLTQDNLNYLQTKVIQDNY